MLALEKLAAYPRALNSVASSFVIQTMKYTTYTPFPKSVFLSRNQRTCATTSRASSEKKEKVEIRVCTNRTCRKQGSLDIFQVLTGISPPSVTVMTCGCLGKCGSGPNIIILPDGVFVGHCGTPSKAADTMLYACGVDDEDDTADRCLKALALRKRAEDETGRGELSQARDLLSQAIDLKPFGGLHILYKERSGVRLAMGDTDGALEDIKEALTLARYYPEAYVCEGDVLMVMNKLKAAEESYSIALDLDPSMRRSKQFKVRISKLQEKLATGMG